MSADPLIRDATEENFRELVLINSRKGPVVVNYWAPWAGPCVKLWPLLEKLVREYGGRFLLVNVNTDRHKSLAKAYGVNSLPTVKVFRNEQVVGEIHGAESEGQFRTLLDKFVPRASDAVLADAVRRYQRGEIDAAFDQMRAALESDPDNERIALSWAKLLLREQRFSEAASALERLPEQRRRQADASTLLAHAQFMDAARDAPAADELVQRIEHEPDDLEARYQLAALKLLGDEYRAALDQLLEIIRRDPAFKDQAPRNGVVAITNLLGSDHPLAKEFRQRLFELLG